MQTLYRNSLPVWLLCLVLLLLSLSACTTGGEFNAQETVQVISETAVARVTEVHAAQLATETAREPVPVQALSSEINPLTGLPVSDPALLDRRPVIVKVQNLPRPRLQWGVSQADLVYEYYTELGTTRFAAIFYGNSPQMVAPIRSARWMDFHLVRMYESVLVFGSAYAELLNALLEAEFSPRILIEQPGSCPAICRYDPNDKNYLTADLSALNNYLARWGIDNTRQNLTGMTFDAAAPAGGSPAERVYARFSTAVYNRWDYDADSGRYRRFSDVANARFPSGEEYETLIDQSTGAQIAVENVLVILAEYELLIKTESSEVFDVALLGEGMAYLVRDGQLYNVRWERPDTNSPLRLRDPYGQPFPFKPGQTWIEVMGLHTHITRADSSWRFEHRMP